MNVVCILIVLFGISWTVRYFWRYLDYEITNDAYVDQYIAPINIRVAGYIQDVRFREHQYVHKGDTLLLLDDREYKIRVKEAEAALLDAEGSKDVLHSGIQTTQANIAVQEANIAEAKARLWQSEQDYHRYARLLQDESVAPQQFEQVKATFEAAQARYDALVQQREAVVSQHTEATKRQTSADANILRQEAALDIARLNLSYTVITAPYDGYMGRRTLEPGQYVSAGQTLSYIVRSRDKWITANYRETQIANIYIGQEVRIRVDAIEGRTFTGRVSAISEATGSKYSLVPTDNSAGNFVKVQQRIPVRIDLVDVSDEDMAQLRAGMMVITEAFPIRPSACPLPTRGVRLPQHARHLDGDVDASLRLYLRPRLTLFFSSASTLTTTYLTSVLSVDSVHTNSLSLYLIPGFAVGGFVCFWWFRWQRWRFRFLIAGGMACYALYFAILYFGVSPASTYEMLYFPMFLRGLGMMILVIAFGVFVVEEIDPKLMLTNAFFVISVRFTALKRRAKHKRFRGLLMSC